MRPRSENGLSLNRDVAGFQVVFEFENVSANAERDPKNEVAEVSATPLNLLKD